MSWFTDYSDITTLFNIPSGDWKPRNSQETKAQDLQNMNVELYHCYVFRLSCRSILSVLWKPLLGQTPLSFSDLSNFSSILLYAEFTFSHIAQFEFNNGVIMGSRNLTKTVKVFSNHLTCSPIYLYPPYFYTADIVLIALWYLLLMFFIFLSSL